MMSEVIRQETVVFLLSVLHGAALTFVYDLIRAMRRAVAHSLAAISAEDFLFWIAAGFSVFCLAFFRTDGVIRAYVAAGIAIGAVLYHCSLSGSVLEIFSRIFVSIKRMICRILRFLSWPVKKYCHFWQKTIEIVKKNGYNKLTTKIRGNCYGRKKEKTKQ